MIMPIKTVSMVKLPGWGHRNLCISKVRGLVWVKQNLVMSRGPRSLASAGVGGLWVWLCQRERKRKWGRDTVKKWEPHPASQAVTGRWVRNLQSFRNTRCASIISILHSHKVTICTQMPHGEPFFGLSGHTWTKKKRSPTVSSPCTPTFKEEKKEILLTMSTRRKIHNCAQPPNCLWQQQQLQQLYVLIVLHVQCAPQDTWQWLHNRVLTSTGHLLFQKKIKEESCRRSEGNVPSFLAHSET